jgi:hypothetical protein
MHGLGPWREIGVALIVIGVLVAAVGLALLLFGRQLPGDFLVQRGRFTVFVPITTMVLLSLLLTVLLNLFRL